MPIIYFVSQKLSNKYELLKDVEKNLSVPPHCFCQLIYCNCIHMYNLCACSMMHAYSAHEGNLLLIFKGAHVV